MDRSPIQSIWRFTKAGASAGSALIAARLMTTCPVRPQPKPAGSHNTTSPRTRSSHFRISRLCHEMSSIIGAMKRTIFIAVLALAVTTLQRPMQAEDQAYKLVDGWGPLPSGITWGEVPAMTIDKEGRILAFHRNQPN